LQVLVALTIGKQDRVGAPEGSRQPLAVENATRRARHDEASCADTVTLEQRGELLAEAFTDPDRRGAVAGRDVDADGIDQAALGFSARA
jgi:hypothetical protein